MAHIFISYSRADVEFALKLKQQLTDNNFEVWIDLEGIDAGRPWKQEIVDAIEICSAFVIILSPRSAQSYMVMRELTYAKEERRLILPWLMEGELWPLVADTQYATTIDGLIQALKHVPQLYMCHVQEDEGLAAHLKGDLTNLWARVWQPQDQATSHQHPWDSSQIMLLMISPESMRSSEIREQWKKFDDLEKTIIPLLVQQTSVPRKIREKQPYVDFFNQDYHIAFGQLYGILETLVTNLKDYEKIPIPKQPPLSLDGFDMVNEAEHAIWISGITLDTWVSNLDVLVKALEKPNLKIHLLMLELDVQAINEVAAWIGINPKAAANLPVNPAFEDWAHHQEHTLTIEGRSIAQRLFENRPLLQSVQQEHDRIEIRTMCHRLGMGHFIIDPYSENLKGTLTASPYLYKIDQIKATRHKRFNTSPIVLSQQSPRPNDLWWYDQYVQEFDRLWNDATRL
jgi:TIR domain